MSNEPYVSAGQQLNEFLPSFWQRQINAAESDAAPEIEYNRHPPLPLARIKKVMKSDPEVKGQMISADAPILFCKACEIFISELTARAFIMADMNKRRTVSRQDIIKAIGRSDQFDFLIDIIPRDGDDQGRPKANSSSLAGLEAGEASKKDEKDANDGDSD